jgi:hypothetical protein
MYNIWKILFSAEKYHLNKYGCPVTGDTYIAMEYGTVPSQLYDMTKTKRTGIGFYKDGINLVAERVPMTDYLSTSAIIALQYGFDEYAKLDFNEVMNKNHEEQAWKDNYINNVANPIPFEELIDEKWLREDLSQFAQYMVV